MKLHTVHNDTLCVKLDTVYIITPCEIAYCLKVSYTGIPLVFNMKIWGMLRRWTMFIPHLFHFYLKMGLCLIISFYLKIISTPHAWSTLTKKMQNNFFQISGLKNIQWSKFILTWIFFDNFCSFFQLTAFLWSAS